MFSEMKLRDKTEGIDAVDRALTLLYDAPEVEISPEERERQLREMKSDTPVNCRTCGDNTERGCKTKSFAAAWVCQEGGYKYWKPRVYKGCYPEFDRYEIDEHIEGVLNKAGFFELLEAANKASKDFTNWLAAHEPDREIYRFQYLEKTMRELDAVIAKITWAGDS